MRLLDEPVVQGLLIFLWTFLLLGGSLLFALVVLA